MDTERAYSTDSPEAVAAYLQTVAARNAFGPTIRADVEALGAGPNVFVVHGSFGVPDRIQSLAQAGEVVPDGWKVAGGQLVPRRGKPGAAARLWLAEHQPPDVRHTMEAHGLPRACWLPKGDGFGWRIVTPKLFEQEGTLWACYQGEPGTSDSGFDSTPCTWTPRKLSEFWAASEAFDEAHAAAPAVS